MYDAPPVAALRILATDPRQKRRHFGVTGVTFTHWW
jgi:hypothetical protein